VYFIIMRIHEETGGNELDRIRGQVQGVGIRVVKDEKSGQDVRPISPFTPPPPPPPPLPQFLRFLGLEGPMGPESPSGEDT